MRTVPGLMGEKIGDYLSCNENQEILSSYFMAIDLKTDLIAAIRKSLSGPLFLPGEAQQIDNIVETFSICYALQNSEVNQEIIYILTFALIMLNSDLHNPNVQKKITCNQFIQNVKGCLPLNSISDEELSKFYNMLKEHPLKFSSSSNQFMAMSAPQMRGFLKFKPNKKFSKFKKRYFVLANSCLYYFKDDSELSKDTPLGMIQLTEVDVSFEFPHNKELENSVVLSSLANEIQYVKFDKKRIPQIKTGVKRIFFKSNDKYELDKWLIRIRKSSIISNFQGNENN